MSSSARRDVFVSFERWGWDERGWALNTRRRYVLRAKAADTWLRAQGKSGIVWATLADLRAYLYSTKPTAQTRNDVRSALVGFGAFTVAMGWRASNEAELLPRLPVQRSIPRALDAEHARRIVVMADTYDLMHRVLIYVFMYGGLRKSEARLLEWTHVSRDGRWLRFTGKGGKERSIPLADPARDLLVAYRSGPRDPRWVFPSPRGGDRAISSTYVQNIVKELGTLCGVPELHPHILRHTLATALLDTGSDIRDIQEWLGHASPSTTAIYTRVKPARLLEASRRLEYR